MLPCQVGSVECSEVRTTLNIYIHSGFYEAKDTLMKVVAFKIKEA